MIKHDLVKLVKTLSGSEKRAFKLYSNKQEGSKIYLDLFDMLTKSDTESVQRQFLKKYPGKDFENACRYLLKIITDCLVSTRKENDKWFQQHQALMRSRILMERSITKQGYRELKQAQQLAGELQDNLVYYFTCCLDIKYWSDAGFVGKTEDEIVQMHMNAKTSLRLLHKIQEQSSLFDILKFRGLHSGKSLSKKDNEKLNDLLITELTLVTRDFQENFESKKLHLLFQSFFFINSGDYKSSLNCFYELNELFEQNEPVWGFPPYDYLATLDGVLDNLRTIRYYNEMNYYVEKLEKLAGHDYPESFRVIAMQMVYTYKLTSLIHQGQLAGAALLANSIPPSLVKDIIVPDYQKLTELLFTISLISFLEKNYKKAMRQLGHIINIGKINFNLPIFKASRLMQILIYYELNDLAYLDYEIRSYKRMFQKNGKATVTESMVLKVVQFDPNKKSKFKRQMLWKKISNRVDSLQQDKYERQMLKFYDFTLWMRNKLYY